MEKTKVVGTKVALVTGGAKGIGAACVQRLARAGWATVVHYHHSHVQAKALAASLLAEGCQVMALKADVTSRAAMTALIEQVREQWGDVDLLVNNAGIAQSKLFTELCDDDWEQMMAVHLKGAFYCSQLVLPAMIARQAGKIINIASIWGLVGAACEVHYSVAKAGLIGMTKALAKELGPSNIQVNCVAPGVILTDMLAEYTDEDRAALCEQTPLMRLGQTEDVAAAVAFLASKDGDFMTGQVLSPNGGLVI
ncbi:elongation factor P 5-aminopentanone reductase [Heliophilum fasciatum]|uniref:3-oxoacyl-[acyl-carrier protein] reductase n=1 Tax=Heliophilum fasciatum TaxID=35700 RepID=A0A4R2RSN8_9FIRM|nr:3-oxoacyl-ACP reductase FabG [Heliophilum fasciatum]MCW2277434.1 3-oxoacyl-[acyl-carrier protein] reductase [Heliophilum fasciatum]TCP67270.1 3-oxoacyl-[acyl-carrier protein] reductase [Heliophilum fasciatum]